MDCSRDIEQVGDELLSYLWGSTFVAKLAAITTEKGSDLVLESFRTRKYGWADMEAELPALYVMGLRKDLIKDDGLSRSDWFKFAIEVYISGDDAQQLERMTNRYARAIEETLFDKYRDDGLVTATEFTPVLRYENGLFKVCSVKFQLNVFSDTT